MCPNRNRSVDDTGNRSRFDLNISLMVNSRVGSFANIRGMLERNMELGAAHRKRVI